LLSRTDGLVQDRNERRRPQPNLPEAGHENAPQGDRDVLIFGAEGVRLFVTICPKTYAMYSDAVKTLSVEDHIEVKNLIELVTVALG
jgi:Fe-S oxidoreductase